MDVDGVEQVGGQLFGAGLDGSRGAVPDET
jgi:hypothetical protein